MHKGRTSKITVSAIEYPLQRGKIGIRRGRPRSQFRTGVFGNRYPITRPVTFLRQHFEPKSPILRRECIYAFRGLLFQNRRVEWENVENTSWEITIQQTTEVIQHFGTDKSVPYAHAGRRPIHLPDKFQFAV